MDSLKKLLARFQFLFSGKFNLFQICMVLAIFVFVNWVGLLSNRFIDCTPEKIFVLNDKTKNLLDNLKDKVEIYVFMQETNPLFPYLKRLLNVYKKRTPLLLLTYVDPVTDIGQTKILANKCGIDFMREMIVVEYQFRSKILYERDFALYDYSGVSSGMPPILKSFSGENALTSSLLDLIEGKKIPLHFLIGHGERSIEKNDFDSLTLLKDLLLKNNFSVETLHLLGKKSIPKEVKNIIIASPQVAFTKEELLSLDLFLKKGGNLVCLVDPFLDINLVHWFNKYHVHLNKDLVLDPERQRAGGNVLELLTLEYNKTHPITEKMLNIYTIFLMARSVSAIGNKASPYVFPLTQTSQNAWGELDYDESSFAYNKKKDLPAPLSIAVAVEHLPIAPSAKMIVIGDSDFISNRYLHAGGNHNFFENMLHWMTNKKDRIHISPKIIDSAHLTLSRKQLSFFFILFVLIIPLFWFSLALLLYIKRRH